MSSDAKVWHDGHWWKGIADLCQDTCHHESLDLIDVLRELTECNRGSLHWAIRYYPKLEKGGLVGYGYPREDD